MDEIVIPKIFHRIWFGKKTMPVVVFGAHLFYPYLPLGPDSPAYAVHHFAGSW